MNWYLELTGETQEEYDIYYKKICQLLSKNHLSVMMNCGGWEVENSKYGRFQIHEGVAQKEIFEKLIVWLKERSDKRANA